MSIECLHPEERRRNFVVDGVLVAQWCRDCFARRDFAIMNRDTKSDLIAAMILDGAPDPFSKSPISNENLI